MQPELSFSRLDSAFAEFMGQRSALQGQQREHFCLLIKRLSAMQMSGHSCLPINAEEHKVLRASSLVADNPPYTEPFVIEQQRLYSQRFWNYESRLAQQLFQLSRQRFSFDNLHAISERYFAVSEGETDWQLQAALNSATSALSIINGGPGTGKTTTVVKILAILQELHDCHLHIALAAPTGKAAMRLQESINVCKQHLRCTTTVLQAIPEKVSTLHHLLGAQPPTPFFHHDQNNPLPFDLVVVDEASMIDLALMSKLVDALKPQCRLVLLGDKDQLASVESGIVLQDLIHALPACTHTLRKTHRFKGAIKHLASAVNEQYTDLAWRTLNDNHVEVSVLHSSALSYIQQNYKAYWQQLARNADFLTLFATFNQFRVLCANRHGARSTQDINFQIEQQLHAKPHSSAPEWYTGKPVLITENCHSLHLYNGDIGICLPDDERDNQLSVFFLTPQGTVKRILPGQMPACEPAYAMTIHKSQGSEFNHVLMILPEQINPVLSKELIYTGITRAKQRLILDCSESIFKQALQKRIKRYSGLADKLQSLAQ